MRAWIILTGDELIEGRTRDANGDVVARALRDRGHAVARIVTVGDGAAPLAAALAGARAAGAGLAVVTGGLGGTPDDLTRDGVATFLGVELARDETAARQMRATREARGLAPPPEPWPESLLPAGATAVRNVVGLAPGFIVGDAPRILVLPGVPAELRAMIEDGALDAVPPGKVRWAAETVKAIGLTEPEIARRLGDLMARDRNPLIGLAAKTGEVHVAIRAAGPDVDAARRLVDADVERVAGLLGGAVYTTAGEELHEVVARLLLDRSATVVVAESLTGGLVGDRLTDCAGVSAAFLAAHVTYADAAKTSVLGVDQSLLAAHGAVSEPVVRAMAEGARARHDADFAVATSGIAGPGGGSAEKPVGTAWVAACSRDGCAAEVRVHGGRRREVKVRAARHALDLLRRVILGG